MRKWGWMLIALAMAQPAWAKMYKWVDEQGKTHYGDTIPPQYAGQGSAELDKKGMEVRKTEGALSEEQRKAREAAQAKQKAEAQKALEAGRRDKALLNTYTSEQEIDLARDRHLQAADAVIQSTRMRIKAARARLDGYRKQVGGRKPLPKDLADGIREAEEELQRLQETVRQKQQEQAEIRARFEADTARFRELKGIAAPAPAGK